MAALEVKLEKRLIANKDGKIFKFLLGGIKVGEASYVAKTEATVLVGIDVGKIEQSDIKLGLGNISLTLPPIEILDFSYPAETFSEDELYSKGKAFKLKEEEEIYRDGEMEIRKMLPYLGLETEGQEKVSLILRPILSEMGYENIEIKFHPSVDLRPDKK